MSRAMDLVRRAQAESLMGPYEPVPGPERAAPYVGVGQMQGPYDFSEPVAILEMKAALKALGELAADKFRTSDPAIETRWRDIIAGEPSWDAAAADEFAIAIGRYRGLGVQVPGPYAVDTPGGPQPTATGLELIAGAVNDLLGGSPRMLNYESWRGGSFAPPSIVSGPAADTPVIHTDYFGTDFRLPPADTRPDVLEQIVAANGMITDAQKDAMFNRPAESEQVRAQKAADMMLGRSIRDAWIAEALAESEVTGETHELTVPEKERACIDLGGQWNGESCVTPPEPAPSTSSPASPAASRGALVALGSLGLLGLLAAKLGRGGGYGRLSGSLVRGKSK